MNPFTLTSRFRNKYTLRLGAGVIGVVAATAAAAPIASISFEIIGGAVRPREPFAARFTVLGSAIYSTGNGGYHLPVTMRLHLKDPTTGTVTNLNPFGPFNKPLDGNVNADVAGSSLDPNKPLKYVLRGTYPADMEITISGQSWRQYNGVPGTSNGDYYSYYLRNSADDPTWVTVLRHGDPVPNVPGYQGQTSAEEFLMAYIDPDSDTMVLHENEAIYLFELGADDPDSSANDIQDLVVLVRLADTPMVLEDELKFD